MTQSEELELNIFRFAESAGKAKWRAINLPLRELSAECYDEHFAENDPSESAAQADGVLVA